MSNHLDLIEIRKLIQAHRLALASAADSSSGDVNVLAS